MVAGLILMAIGLFMTPRTYWDQLFLWEKGNLAGINPTGAERKEFFRYDFSDAKLLKLEIRVTSEDVMITPTDGDVLEGEWISGKSVALRHELVGDTLRIGIEKDRSRIVSFFHWTGGGRLNLLVPKKLLLDLDIQTVSGDIVIDLPKSGKVSLRTTSGSVHGKWNEVKLLAVSTTSGQIAADVSDGSVDVEITSLSGDVELRAATLTGLDVETTSGEIEVRAREVKAPAGRLYSLSGDVDIHGVSKATGVDVRTLSGRLSLWDMSVGKNFSQPGNGILSVETTSGNITVK